MSMLILATKLTNGRVNSRSTKWCTRSMLCSISGTSGQRRTSKCRVPRGRRTCFDITNRRTNGHYRAALTATNCWRDRALLVAVDSVIAKKAEQQIESCEHCHPADAETRFDWLLAEVTGNRGPYEFVLSEPARCPNCRHEITEKTLVEPKH